MAIALGTCLVAFAVPAGASAYRRYRTALERAKLAHFLQDPQAQDEGWREDPAEVAARRGAEKVDGERESDDPVRRAIAARTLWGTPTGEVAARHAEIAHQESLRWAALMPSPGGPLEGVAPSPQGLVTAPSWVNVGPVSADFAWNAVEYPAIDAGRVSGILVHPADPAQVVVALSGGGLWKAYDFGAAAPAWSPIGDALPNLAIGAIDANPSDFDELYVGTGDFIDGIGGQMVKSAPGGGWSAPVQLTGRDPSGAAVTALRVNVVKVDPANPAVVLVGTDVGLFRSTDAGASYQLLDLPNSGGPARLERVWTIAYTGQVGGVSRWAASGVYACGAGLRPPETFFGSAPSTSCSHGNPGDIWTSTDAGATWSSRRAAGGLPGTVGRITLAAGTPSFANPPVTVLYAQASVQDELGGSASAGFWRSVDSGATWVSANGTLANPTQAPGPAGPDCPDIHNAGFVQGSYNQALAVDPGDNNRVLAGGMLCAMRTQNGLGGPTWENVTHWLPFVAPYGDTAAGTLAYVHADHHRALIVRFGNTVRALLATDGGVYWSDSLFAAGPPTSSSVVFRGANQGMVTHLVFGMGSGDPATGTPNRVIIGLQDNGTRVRDHASAPTTFNQVNGGDGFGAAYGRDPGTGAEVYWGASNYNHDYCVPSAANAQCNSGGSFFLEDPPLMACGGGVEDGFPFKNSYAPVLPGPANTFLTSTDRGVYRISGSPLTNDWAQVTPTCAPGSIRFVAASQAADGLYGAGLTGGRYQVTSNCAAPATACTWTVSSVVGADLDGSGAVDPDERTSFTSSLAFPPGPTGRPAGDVYVVTTAAPLTQDGKTPVPDALGHIFLTTDRGTTFAPIKGNGTGQDLPNVPINVVRYDAADTTNQTLFAGTLIGVYRTTDGGNTWHRYGVGLPLANVTDMFIGRTGGIVRVGTYGRGVWEIYPNASAERGVSGNGDWDRDLRIDFIDLAALAIRLGTSPATAATPFYDWTVDLTGTANAIDDADLSALLARFGDHP